MRGSEHTAGYLERKTLVVGLGKTGLSCARYLASHGVPLAVTDSRERPPALETMREELPDVALYVGGFSASAFDAAEQLVVSPGVSLREPQIADAIARGVPVLGDIELFARNVRAPVVAVTGTNGKSTVTSLVAEMARRSGRTVHVGGNLGTPVLELFASGGNEDPDSLYVLELSSFQLETTCSLNAVAGVVLNVSADHMDRYDSVAEYAAVKSRIYRGDGAMVINADDPLVRRMAIAGRRTVRFTLGAPGDGDFGLIDRDGVAWLARGTDAWVREDALRMRGRHNTANALAALALGDVIGLDRAAMLEALREFPGLAHRCQWLAEQDGVSWYNDSKATNVGAAIASLRGMRGRVVLIAGGDGKDADFAPLRDAVADKARAVVLLGRDAPRIRAALADEVETMVVSDMREAVVNAAGLARPGDSVLLAPACASFDMFENFEARGDAFAAALREVLS